VPQESRSPLAQAAVVEARVVVEAVAPHEDEADLATEVDVEDPEEDSAEAVVVAVASQEAAVVVASPEVVLAAAVALADVDVEATKAARGRFEASRSRAPLSATPWSILSLSWACFECHDYYQPIPRSSFDGVWELRWDLCKRSNIWRHVGNCLRRLLGIHIYQLIFKLKKGTQCHMRNHPAT
jgi:hypothetical protein